MNLLLFVFSILFTVQCAPKSSSLKRLRELEAATDAANIVDSASGASSSSGVARGSLQRLRAATESAAASSSDGTLPRPFTASLKRDWAAGEITAKRVQEYAMNAAAQGAHSLERLASLGASGKHIGNMHRDLLAVFGNPKGAPSIDWINLPGKDGATVCQPFLMPHRFFSCLYEQRHETFLRHLRGPMGSAREYWENLASSPFVLNHPLLSDLDNAFPIGLHGDAGPFTKHESLLAISWNGLLGRDMGRTKRIVFTFVRKRDYTPETLNRIWKIFAWSVNCMAVGKHPLVDWDNNAIPNAIDSPLAGPYTAVLTQIRGDWQFYVEIFSFPPWNGAVRMCWMCRASGANPHLAFTDCSTDARWRSTRFSDESYRAHMLALGLSIPALLLFVVGLRLECISIDSLHAFDLGFGAHVVGNTFWESITRRCWGKANLEDNTAELEKDMKDWAKRNKISARVQGQLHKERIRSTSDSGYPKLKAKGAQTRQLMPYAKELAVRFQRVAPDPNATHDLLVVGVCTLCCELFNLYMTSGRFFTDAVKRKIVIIGNQLPFMYQRLYTEAYNAGVKAWKMTPKLHLIQELLLYQCLEWGNPLYYWCYGDEDLVGSMVEIAQSCHMSTVVVTSLVKWLILSFDTEREDQD